MDEHKSAEQILEEIDQAKTRVELGSDYRHYKNRKIYRPLQFATFESNDELCVVYQAQYGSKLLFVRPLKDWVATVDWQGNKLRRFEKLT